MTRKWGIVVALGLSAVVATWWWWPAGDAQLAIVRSPDQNVLVVTIDTLRADALGSYGGVAATPNLDAVAADGIQYDFAHAHAVITLPSHVSVFSGLIPPAHGVRDNSGYRVPRDTVTLATMLKSRGFATGAFIGGYPLDSQFGLDAGFDVYDDRVREVRGPATFAESERPAGEVVASALAWIGQRGRDRWFAWVHLYDPHAPNRPPEPFAKTYANNPYAGEVAYTDHALGPLFEAVRAVTDRPTLVIVTSDHGEGLGDHGEATHGIFAYEAMLRVPLIVAQYSKGQATAGRPHRLRLSALSVQHIDILPSVLDALQVAAPPELPGRSLFGLATEAGRIRAGYFEALAPSLNRGWAPLTGVLVDRDKYIELPLPELYDLSRDPAEADNLASRQSERTEVLRSRLKAFGPTAPGARMGENAETTERLRALGYTSGSAAPRTIYTEDDDPKRLIGLDQEMMRSVELFNVGRLREAADIYRAIIDRRPGMGLAYLHLSFLDWEMGRRAEAIATLRRAIERGVSSAEVQWKLGMYLSEVGALDQALPILEQAAVRPDAGVDALNALGIAYARSGQTERALEVFERILSVDVRNAMALQNMGSAELAAGHIMAARAAFARAIEVNPDWAASHTGLGAAESRLGHRDAAIEAWKRAVSLNSEDYDALFNLGTELVNAGQFEAARPYLVRFVESAPRDAYGADVARLAALLQNPPRTVLSR
ncbi:MAG: sulfatase-like hydrolase/transferase [Acidobacteriota bacterium]